MSIKPTTAHHPVRVRALAGRIGAVLTDVDLKDDLGEDQVREIRGAILAHRVVFFPGQFLDVEQHLRFARHLGPLTTAHPTIRASAGSPNIYDLDSLTGARANHWHTDVTFVERPPTFSVLRAEVIPDVGGDTLWANTVAAFADLRSELQELARNLRVLHTNGRDYATPSATRSSDDDPSRAAFVAQFVSQIFETEHPMVRVHPETGEEALLLGGFAQGLIDYPAAIASDLLRVFQNQVTRPENTVRWGWSPGDVAVWDNRATQHYAIYDYGTAHRQVQRVTTAGEVPVGLDGRRSVALKGDITAYLQI